MPEPDRPTARDEALLAELGAHFDRTDPPPAAVTEAAKAAIEVLDLDGQIAELLRDSAVESEELAGVRGTGARLLTFAVGEDRFVEVDVAFAEGHLTLTGYLVPGAPGALTVEQASAPAVTAEVDTDGRFLARRVVPGPVRLRFVVDGQPPVSTQWLTL